MPILLSRQPLRHRCRSLPVPDHFILAVGSLRPSVKQARRKIVEYNNGPGAAAGEGGGGQDDAGDLAAEAVLPGLLGGGVCQAVDAGVDGVAGEARTSRAMSPE